MTGWIIYTGADALRNSTYIDWYITKFKARNIDLQLKIREDISICITDGSGLPDFAIVRTIEPLLNKQLEMHGVRVFNNYRVSSLCNCKAATYQYLYENGIEIPKTWIGGYKGEDFPVVMKPNDGHGGKNVVLVRSREEYDQSIKLFKDGSFVVQSFVSDPGKDVRVYVIGKKIIAAMLRESSTDFRSNFCLGGKASVYNLSTEETALVNKIIDLFDFDFVGIDFMFNKGKIIFNEIEDVVGSRMLYTHTDIDIVEMYVDYIAEKLNSLNQI